MTAHIGGLPATVLYAGSSGGIVSGVIQVNLADDQDPVAQTAQFEFPEQEARHDRPAGPGVVCQ
ncbi:MAG: hypothetical protein ACLQU1_04480 [Bryobacteraceae bacterium]